MALLATLTLKVGSAVAKTAAKGWLKDHGSAGELAGELVDLLTGTIDDFETLRATTKLFEDLKDEVGRRLAAFVDSEFPALAENERQAAAIAVGSALDRISFLDDALRSDLDATRLEAVAKARSTDLFVGLNTETAELARRLLYESCAYAVTLADKLPTFQVRATRELLRRHRDLADDLSKALAALAAMSKQPSGVAEEQTFEVRYRHALVLRLDRMELFGLRLAGAAREYGLTVAYVSLSATSAVTPLPGSVETALDQRMRVIIRGEAGSGKTTLLKWLAVRTANADFSGALTHWNRRIPFYVRLRDYVDKEFPVPAQFIEGVAKNLSELMPKLWCERQLDERGLVLLDGFDELPSARREGLFEWLRQLTQDFPKAVVILTSRPAALDAQGFASFGRHFQMAAFESLTLEPMTLTESEALVTQWHMAVAKDHGQEAERERLSRQESALRQTLRDRTAIRNLAASPLLCAMMCALNWVHETHLPDRRMDLYELALNMMLTQRDEERVVRAARIPLDGADKRELLEAVAHWFLRNGLSEASREQVAEQLELRLRRHPRIAAGADDVLQELLERSGILRQPQHGVVDFVHRTFLEYLAAKAIIDARDIRFLVNQAQKENWRETIVFAAGHARGKTRDELIGALLEKPLFGFGNRAPVADITLACCLETVGRSLDPQLLEQVSTLAASLFPPQDFASAVLLAPAASMNPELLEGHPSEEAAIAACIRTAATVGGERMLKVIESYSHVERELVDTELGYAWDSFADRPFAERVIRRRKWIFGLDVGSLNDEAVAALRLICVVCGASGSTFVRGRVKRFIERSSLVLLSDRLLSALPLESGLDWLHEESNRLNHKPFLWQSHTARISELVSTKELWITNLDDQSLRAVAELPSLETLRLGVARRVAFDPLASAKKLQSLSLVGDGLREGDFQMLPRTLQRFALGYSRTSLRALEPLSQLTALQLRHTAAPAQSVLGGLTKLKELRLGELTSRPRLVIGELRQLETLWLDGGVDLSQLELSEAASLRSLRLTGADALRLLEELPKGLRELTVLRVPRLDLAALDRTRGLSMLRLFNVSKLVGESSLLGLKELRELVLEDITIFPKDLMNQLQMRGVRVSTLGYGGIDDRF
jgi:hypothetical protein